MFARAVAYISDDAIQLDAAEGEAGLRKDCPELMTADERVVFAFKGRGGAGRDDKFFTTRRILIRNVQGMTGQSIKYQSLPYYAVKAFSVETAGATLDFNCGLELYSSGTGSTSMKFVAGTDIMAIARFLNEAVLSGRSTGFPVPAGAPTVAPVPVAEDARAVGSLLDVLGGDASQIDPSKVEEQLRRDPDILMEDERVELAFKCGRDSFLFTSKRLLSIDVKGLSGTRVKFLSVLWKCIRAYSVESAGSWDRDAEMVLFTNIRSVPRVCQDFRKGRVDLMAVQKYITDKLLGQDLAPVSTEALRAEGHEDAGPGSALAWLGDDSRMVDAAEMERRYRADPPILQPSEHVEMAFKGRRDLALFTTKRLLQVDFRGWSGRKVDYFSVPWASVQMFGVRSAGSWMDKDSEMMIWTDINDVQKPPGDNPPIPRKSYIEIDFQKDKVDLMAIQRYLTARCLPSAGGGSLLPPEVPVPSQAMQATPPGAVERFLNWVGDDAHAIDAGEVDRRLHAENPVLQEDERVCMAFRSGRDMVALTSKRALLVDVQGFTGSKVEWKSVPYASLRAFSVESAGSWDRDAEFKLYCKTYWARGSPGSVLKQDLRKGRADIIAIQAFLAAQVIGAGGEPATVAADVEGAMREAPAGLEGFLAWMGGDAHEISPEEANKALHESPPILQADESVDLCFKVGRDMCVFTTKRVLLVDVQGFTGQKVEYRSIPLKYCTGYAVRSAGSVSFLANAFCTVYTDVPGASKVKQDLTKSHTNIWSIQTLFSRKLLRREAEHDNEQSNTAA